MAKNSKLLFWFFLPLIILGYNQDCRAQKPGVTDDIISAIKAGDAGRISAHFHTAIDLTVPGSAGIYSKNQAQQILKVFFKDHKVTSFEIKFKGNSKDGSNYAIGELKCGLERFRVYFLVKPTNSVNLIHQLQIEKEE